MPHTRAEVFWQIPNRRDRQDEKKSSTEARGEEGGAGGGVGTLEIDWAIINNYSPKANLILLNNPRDEVEGIIQQY